MSSRKSEDDPITRFLTIVAIVIGYIVMFLLFVAAVVTFVITVLAIFAWHRPIIMGPITLSPMFARAFVKRGLAGAGMMIALFLFLLLCVGIEAGENPFTDWRPWVIVALPGYMLGSTGIEILFFVLRRWGQKHLPQVEDIEDDDRALPSITPVIDGFAYASWVDEDARR